MDVTDSELLERLRRDAPSVPPDRLVEWLRREIPALDLAERFRLLHELGVYHDVESLSGAGSSLAETEAIRGALPRLFRERGIRSLLDLPCGDHHWMSRVDLAGIDYLGADVVPELVEENRRRHGAAGKRFELLDATRDPLPQVDLVFCRDLLIHLSNADAAKLLANVARSGSRWLLTTHFTGHRANLDILSGDFRPLNLCRPPFLLPPPVEVIAEESRLSGGIFPDRAMGLWEVASLP